MPDCQQAPVLLFATPPPLDQLLALTIRISDANISQAAAKMQPQVIKCREFIFTEPDVIGTPSADIKDWSFHLIAQASLIKSGRLQSRLARVGLQVSPPHRVSTELYQSCLRYTLTARLSPTWNKAGPWLVQGRDFLTNKGCANAIRLDLTMNQSELYFTLEATTLKLSPLQVGDLDILGSKLEQFLNRPDMEIHHDSIASDWCFVLPSMKRGRIVSISHEIPEDSPFVSYRDLKRHWKNTYGYRLPDDEDGVIYYQVHFGPLGGKLFTYPEMCLRGRDLQKMLRVDPKPILRKFIAEVTSKFPTICGQPLKLQSKAKFTFPDLLEGGQINQKNPANLTGKMNGAKPALYRSQSEMDQLLSGHPRPTLPVASSVLTSRQASASQQPSSIYPRPAPPVSSSGSATRPAPSSSHTPSWSTATPTSVSGPLTSRGNTPQLSRPASSQVMASKLPPPSAARQTQKHLGANFAKTPNTQPNSQQNWQSKVSHLNNSRQTPSFNRFATLPSQPASSRPDGETPSKTLFSSQASVGRKLFPVFKPSQPPVIQPQLPASQPAPAAPKVRPVFRIQSGKSVDSCKPQPLASNKVTQKAVPKKSAVPKDGIGKKRERQTQKGDKTQTKRKKLQKAED